MKRQATRANRAQVELHIERQRALGESMIDDDDKPEPIEFLITALVLIALAVLWWMP